MENKYSNYMGIGEKPIDFDEFWENGVSEVQQRGVGFKLNQVNIPSNIANFYDLYFNGVGNAQVHCQLLVPKVIKKKHKAMLIFHGYHCDAGDYTSKISWVAEGFVVMAMDCRGQGGQSTYADTVKGDVLKGLLIRGIEEENPARLYYRNVYLDTVQAVNILKSLEYVNEKKIFLQGVSQGGGLAIACAGLIPDIYKVQVCYPFLSDFKKAFKLGDQTAFSELQYWFRYRDPLHVKEKEVFDTLEYIDIKYFAENIKAEVKWAMGLDDQVVPPETQMAAFNRIKSSKELVMLPEYGHEYLPKVMDKWYGFFIE
ncbi:MAG: acetylxylan esterase [Liquorilactobacillus hordei]|uniref:acetylxylan esterase n=1 Tax=Liquorilactobacillus hordei TaxID=468911 RepID=UPI0039ECF549